MTPRAASTRAAARGEREAAASPRETRESSSRERESPSSSMTRFTMRHSRIGRGRLSWKVKGAPDRPSDRPAPPSPRPHAHLQRKSSLLSFLPSSLAQPLLFLRYNSKVTHIKGSALAIIGGQWGDEGKGKVVDLISPSFDLVARYQGGHNAGHTVKFGDKHFALRLVPSGICRAGVMNVIGNGLVVDPRALLAEIDSLRAAGVTVGDNLRLSDRAHVILPTHALLDGARGKALGGANIGTTSRGIGPAYESKANRSGLRMADLVDADRFRALARPVLEHHDAVLSHF